MLQIIHNTDDYTVAVSGPEVIILVWKAAATVEGIEATASATQSFLQLKPPDTKLILFTITFPDIAMPESDALTAIGEFLKGSIDVFRASAILHLDTGWRAKLVAALTWAIARAADYPFPHRPYLTLAKAIRWLQTEHDIDGTILVADIRDLISQIEHNNE